MTRFILIFTLSFLTFSVDAMPPKKGGRFGKPPAKKVQPKRGGAGGGGSFASAPASGGAAAAAAQPQLSELGLLYKKNAEEKTFEIALEKLTTADKTTLLSTLQEYGPARLMREMEFYKKVYPTLSRETSDLFLKKALMCYWLRCEMSPAVIPGDIVSTGKIAKERKIWREFIFELAEISFAHKKEKGCLSVGQIKQVQTSFRKCNYIPRPENTVSHTVIENILKSDIDALKRFVARMRDIVFELVDERVEESTPLFESTFLRRCSVLLEYAALMGSYMATHLIERPDFFNSVDVLKKLRCCSLGYQCNYGKCLARNRNYEEAQKWLALGADEEHIPSQTALAVLDAHKELDDVTVARGAAKYTKEEEDFTAWKNRAFTLMHEKKLDKAILLFRRCVDEYGDPFCIKQLVFCYFYQRKMGQAIRVLDKYKDLDHPYLNECRGFMAYHEQDSKTAYTYFLKVENLDDFDKPSLHAFLETSVDSEDYKTAEKIITYCLEHPGIILMPRRLKELHVSILIVTGRLNEARKLQLTHYAEENDEDEKLHLLGELGDVEMRYEMARAKAEGREPDYTQAKKYLRKSLAHNKVRAPLAYGYILRKEGHLDEAIECLSVSDNPNVRLMLGRVYHAKADYENAASCFRDAIRGRVFEATLDLARACVMLKDFKAADRNFKNAIKHGVKGAIEQYAVFLDLQKMFVEAQKYLEYTDVEDEEEGGQFVEEVGGAAAAAAQIDVEGTKKYQRMLARVKAAQERASKDAPGLFTQKAEKTYRDVEVLCASNDVQHQINQHKLRIQGLLTSLANGIRAAQFKRRNGGYFSMRITQSERLIFDILEGNIDASGGVRKIVIVSAEGHFDDRDGKGKADDSKFVSVDWSDE